MFREGGTSGDSAGGTRKGTTDLRALALGVHRCSTHIFLAKNAWAANKLLTCPGHIACPS
jgi:hypothetical protein